MSVVVVVDSDVVVVVVVVGAYVVQNCCRFGGVVLKNTLKLMKLFIHGLKLTYLILGFLVIKFDGAKVLGLVTNTTWSDGSAS